MQQLLKRRWCDGLDQTLDDLEEMDLGSQLSGDELLQLLQFALKNPCIYGFGSGVSDLVRLMPAADQIDDMQGVAALLQQMMVSSMDYDQVQSIGEDFAPVSKLPPEKVADLIHKSISGEIDGFYQFVTQHPAVGRFSTDTIQELLLAVVQRKQQDRKCDQHLADLVTLLTAPAAAQLSVETVTTLLRHAVQEQRHDNSLQQ
jgi:hypothetical protein